MPMPTDTYHIGWHVSKAAKPECLIISAKQGELETCTVKMGAQTGSSEETIIHQILFQNTIFTLQPEL